MRKQLVFFLILIPILFTHKYSTAAIINSSIDTTKSFKIGNFWVTPKLSFDYNSLGRSAHDTLILVTCSEYVYSPFGIINDKSEFKTSLLKNFTIIDRTDVMDIGAIEFQILKLNSSKLIFFFDNDPEASKHSYIFKGEIYNSEVNFIDNIKIGMSVENFYETFFDVFPKELQNRYSVIILESCVADIKHIYNFQNSKLNSVKFESISYWKVEY